ncbi:MAG: terminase family protein [Bacteroidetes bacterium]|nr:terminase family protein [Bacteroidota bacterium]
MSNPIFEQMFLPYQIAWLNDRSPIKIAEKSRRIGWTFVQAFEDVRDIVEGNVPAVWFSSADDSAAREYILYCSDFAKIFNAAAQVFDETIFDNEKKDIKTYVIQFNIGGKLKRITALSSNPKGFRSKGGKVVLDEFAFHEQDRQLWKAAKPATTWGFPIRIISTHHGKNCLYYHFVEDTKNKKTNWSLHTTTIRDAVSQGLLDRIKGRPTTQEEQEAWIADIKRDCRDETIFNEEYMCVAVDESTAFITYELYMAHESETVLKELSECTGDLYLGGDIGRTKDLTVFWINEVLGDVSYARKVIELPKMAFPDQRKILYDLLSLKNMRRACIDSSGIGRQLAEEAQTDFGMFRVEPVLFSNTTKEELAMYGRNQLQDGKAVLPAEQSIRDDFHSIQRSTTATGAIRLDANRNETDGHGDRFWSWTLAMNAARDYNSGPPLIVTRKRKQSITSGF